VDTGNWLFFPGATVKVWALYIPSSFSNLRLNKTNCLKITFYTKTTFRWIIDIISLVLPFKDGTSLFKNFIYSFIYLSGTFWGPTMPCTQS
jgi:hypothetical protein